MVDSERQGYRRARRDIGKQWQWRREQRYIPGHIQAPRQNGHNVQVHEKYTGISYISVVVRLLNNFFNEMILKD